MRKIAAIASVTVREALRQKLAVNLLVFALVLIAASLILSTLTFGERYRIILDIGLSAAEVFGTLIAVFVGAGLVARDVERRTLYPIVAKPVARAEYLAGRYLGLVAITTANLAVMALALVGVLAFYLGGLAFVRETPLVPGLVVLAAQLAVVGSVAVFFSCFTTATLAAIFSLSLAAVGHLSSTMLGFWAREGTGGVAFSRVLYALIPNLEALDLKEAIVYNDPLSPRHVATVIAYAAVYSLLALAGGLAIFGRRDLK